MHKGFLKTSFVLGTLSVALGAFAAHGLKKIMAAAELATFETGVRYQFYHVFALLITAILYKEYPFKTTLIAGRFFMAGILLFSGSLYLLTLTQATSLEGYKWLGVVTPVGGVCFICGWLLLFVAVSKRNTSRGVSK